LGKQKIITGINASARCNTHHNILDQEHMNNSSTKFPFL
jgi:hypothetical protein